MLVMFVTFQSLGFFASGYLSNTSRILLQAYVPHPPRSRDRLDYDHMTAEVHRRWGELVPLVAVHGRLSYFNFDGFSLTFLFNQMPSLARTLTLSLVILWCSCVQCSLTAVSGFLGG